MIRTRLGLLGLCAVVFGLMAFGAAGATAEINAKWLILNAKGELKEGSALHAKVDLEAETQGVLHTEILEIEVLFLCEEIEAVEAKLQEQGIIGNTVVTNLEGLREGRGSKVRFSGCLTDLEKEFAKECTPIGPSGEQGVIISKVGHALIRLHELKPSGVKDDLLELLPDTGLGGVLATIKLPASCPIGNSVPVLGRLFLEDCEGEGRTHLVEHLVRAGPLTELFTISKTPEHAATLLGSAWGFLTGTEVGNVHEGLKFSGDPA